MKNNITEIIYESIKEINEFLDENDQIKLSLNTYLFGDKSRLDSLKFFNLILSIEAKLKKELNKEILLTDNDEGMLQNKNFQTIKSLRDYILTLI